MLLSIRSEKTDRYTGLYSVYERELAELIKKYYPTVELFRALGSGTEADIIAIRLAEPLQERSTSSASLVDIMDGAISWYTTTVVQRKR